MLDERVSRAGLEDRGRAVLDLVLPRMCVVCGRELILSEKYICINCLADMPMTYFWTRSRNQMADRINEKIDGPFEPYSYACALFFYNSESLYKRIPQHLKYRAGIASGRFFARMLGERMASASWFDDIDVVIPVPLYWTRRWNRGYNQAEVIARELAATMNVSVRTDVLRRSRRTGTQTRLSGEAKALNVTGAFSVRPKAFPKGNVPKHILLVDDTFTTGATLYACRCALRAVLPLEVRISYATLAFVTAL